jgi:hypothetical protein
LKDSWDEMNVWAQAMIIAFDQIREIEEFEEKVAFAKVKI